MHYSRFFNLKLRQEISIDIKDFHWFSLINSFFLASSLAIFVISLLMKVIKAEAMQY